MTLHGIAGPRRHLFVGRGIARRGKKRGNVVEAPAAQANNMIVRDGLAVVGYHAVRLPYFGDQPGSHQMMQGIVDRGEGDPRLGQVDGVVYLRGGQMNRPRAHKIQDGLTMRSQASRPQSIYRVVHDVSIRPIAASVIVRMILILFGYAEGMTDGVHNQGATGAR